MGVVGLFVAMLINMFLHSPALSLAISAIGVLLFAGLTAYDTQKIKSIYFAVAGNGEAMAKTRRDRCAEALPRLHQHVPVPAAVHGQPPLSIAEQHKRRGPAERSAGPCLFRGNSGPALGSSGWVGQDRSCANTRGVRLGAKTGLTASGVKARPRELVTGSARNWTFGCDCRRAKICGREGSLVHRETSMCDSDNHQGFIVDTSFTPAIGRPDHVVGGCGLRACHGAPSRPTSSKRT